MAAPTVTNVNPNYGYVNGGEFVTITGTGFLTVTEVEFGEVDALSYTIHSDTLITAVAPPHAHELVYVEVTNPDGNSGYPDAAYFQYGACPPLKISSVNPNCGESGTTVTITCNSGPGANFAGGVCGPATVNGVSFYNGFTSQDALAYTQGVNSITADAPFMWGTGEISVSLTNGQLSSAFAPGSADYTGCDCGASVTVVTGGTSNPYSCVNGTPFSLAQDSPGSPHWSVSGLSNPCFLLNISFDFDNLPHVSLSNGESNTHYTVLDPASTCNNIILQVTGGDPDNYVTVTTCTDCGGGGGPVFGGGGGGNPFQPPIWFGGGPIIVTGSGFTGTTGVTVNGTPVTFTVVDDNTIIITDVTGATSGPIAVTTPSGTTQTDTNLFILDEKTGPAVLHYA